MTNITFPKTNLVGCIFSLRTSCTEHLSPASWDEFDHHVRPSSLKKYVYRVPKHLEDSLAVGDFVLVHCRTGYQVAEIAEVNTLSSYEIESFAPVVCKIDINSYIEEVQTAKQLEAMKMTLEKEKKRLEAMVTYDLIAEKNPEFKAMLEKFREMGGSF